MSDLVMVCGMSRSGTTLLATVLDSHPEVSMGYELLSPDLPRGSEAAALLRAAAVDAGGHSKNAAGLLDDRGQIPLGRLVRRSRRAAVEVDDLVPIVESVVAEGHEDLTTPAAQAALATGVAGAKRAAEGGRYAGFKLNTPGIGKYDELLGQPRFVLMARDPRDVMASHRAHDFGRSAEEVAEAWDRYLACFEDFAAEVGPRARIVRYEDLVCDSEAVVAELAGWLGLDDHSPMLEFADSKASVHRGGHVNAEQLGRGFFTTSIDRWPHELDVPSVRILQGACAERMADYKYSVVSTEDPVPLGSEEMETQSQRLAALKRFHRLDYQRLVEPWVEDRAVMTLAEAMGRDVEPTEKVTYIRHDIDHDVEAAVEIGRWEAEHGIRSTFCVLHSAWYYGPFEDGGYRHSAEMIEAMQELQALGHEINFHNNTVTEGLLSDVDPDALLHTELGYLRSRGLTIRGTAGHGHALCREVGYLNLEQFRETTWHSNGGRRWVSHAGRSVEVGRTPMAAFGLEYESYDLPRDLYITDSGGRPRIVRNTRGRNGLRRRENPDWVPHGHIVGILTHPEYWSMRTDDVEEPCYPSMETLEVEHEERRQANHPHRRAAKAAPAPRTR